MMDYHSKRERYTVKFSLLLDRDIYNSDLHGRTGLVDSKKKPCSNNEKHTGNINWCRQF